MLTPGLRYRLAASVTTTPRPTKTGETHRRVRRASAAPRTAMTVRRSENTANAPVRHSVVDGERRIVLGALAQCLKNGAQHLAEHLIPFDRLSDASGACDDWSMRILVVNSHHYRRGGDSGHFLDHVAALEGRGHEVAVFCMHHEQNLPSVWSEYWAPYIEYRDALPVRDRLRAAWRSLQSGEAARGMRRLLRDFEPEIVHFHSVQHHLTLAVVESCLSAAVPTAWTLHDYRTVCPASALLSRGEVCEKCERGALLALRHRTV